MIVLAGDVGGTNTRLALFAIGEGDDRVLVTSARLNHPNGVSAYRIEHAGKAMVYATDTEHYATPDLKLQKLAKGADLLIYDGQFTPEEYPQKVRWGHSTYAKGAEMAQLADVKELHLFHHDPKHSDVFIDDLTAHAQKLFPNTKAAQEGMRMMLEPASYSVVHAFVKEVGPLDGIAEPELRARYRAWAEKRVDDPVMREVYWKEIDTRLRKR